MAAWTCPRCEREFGAVGRGHVCEPGVSLDAFLDGTVAPTRPVTERILAHLRELDSSAPGGHGLIVDPLAEVLLLKRDGTFATVRPMTKWVAVGFNLDRRLDSHRLGRKVATQGHRHWHVVNVHHENEVDDELLEWLAEAFLPEDGPHGLSSSADPMVPDDVDVEIAPPPWAG